MRETYRITSEMLRAGERALDICRREGGHTPQTVAKAMFIAMLNASDIHPGASLTRSFAWSRHDVASEPLRRSAVGSKKLTRADFDAAGLLKTVYPDGTVNYRRIADQPHLRRAWKAELARKNTKP